MRLLSGQDSVGDYQFNTQNNHHYFCKRCGVRPFGRGNVKEIGGDYVSIMLSTLDNASPVELVEPPIKYANGRDNSWWTEPEEIRHL